MRIVAEADVVVLGLGVAGAVAAAEARDADPSATVLVLEKEPPTRAGGSSRASAGRILCIHPDRAAIRAYQDALSAPDRLPPAVLGAWIDGLLEVDGWLERAAAATGMSVARLPVPPEFPELPGAGCVSHVALVHPAPGGIWELGRRLVGRSGAHVAYGSRAVGLERTRRGLRIDAEQGGREIGVLARRGVVVATGGYEADPDLVRELGGPSRSASLGGPANTGDGFRLLRDAGAELWHLAGYVHPGGLWPAVVAPGLPAAFTRSGAVEGGSWLEIGTDGRRFHDETAEYRWTHAKRKVVGQWRDLPHARSQPVHMVFDDAVRRAGPIVSTGPPPAVPGDAMGWNTVVSGYGWSADNAREVSSGWIARADTLVGLAALVGRDPARLAATVERFDVSAAGGHDPDFGRDPATMRPLSTPPFHAVEIVAGLTFTTGGARRTARGEVVGLDGRPLTGLYEAGQLGSLHVNLFQNGASLAECIVSGRIAGRAAAGDTALTRKETS